MKYLCLISAEKCMEQMAPAEAAQHFEDYRQFNLQLRDSGHHVGGNRLLPPATAKTVRVRNGKATVTDGPWVETKEQLGGYYIFEARDMDEALGLAARIPGSWIGCVEVRPLADDAQTLELLALAAGR
jgi:hypothetical protein